MLIVGGGVIGLTTAYFLRTRHQCSVTILEKGELGREASWAGAGIIPPANLSRATTPLTRLLGLSSELFPQISAELLERTGIDNEYHRCGGVELVSGTRESTVQLWRAEGIEFHRLSGDDLRQLEPELAESIEDGYFLPAMAQVRNPRHLRALIAACRDLGVELIDRAPVRRWHSAEGRISAVDTDSAQWRADQFLVAAGAWSDEVLRMLGVRLPIRPIRGQILLYQPNRPVLRRIISSGLDYLVPRKDGRILVGSTEEDVGFIKGNTPEALNRLEELACQLVPALADSRIETTWSGLRPWSAYDRPILGRVPSLANLFVATGHFRSGLMLSAGTGAVMAQLLAGAQPELPLDSFQP